MEGDAELLELTEANVKQHARKHNCMLCEDDKPPKSCNLCTTYANFWVHLERNHERAILINIGHGDKYYKHPNFVIAINQILGAELNLTDKKTA